MGRPRRPARERLAPPGVRPVTVRCRECGARAGVIWATASGWDGALSLKMDDDVRRTGSMGTRWTLTCRRCRHGVRLTDSYLAEVATLAAGGEHHLGTPPPAQAPAAGGWSW